MTRRSKSLPAVGGRRNKADSVVPAVQCLHAARDYRDGEIIFSQGDPANTMFYIREGTVKLTVASRTGKKAVISILGRGDFLAEGHLAREPLRTATATAIHACVLSRVKKTAIGQLVRQEPAFTQALISHLLARVVRLEEAFADQILSSSERRLARILLSLTESGLGPNPGQVHLRISQETLAEMVGTTRSRVSFFMNRFRDMGLIEYNGGLTVRKELLAFLQEG